MKGRHIGFSLYLGALVVQASTVTAPAADFTCQAYGGSFVLDDSDFKALESSKITRDKFASLAPTSQVRVAICDTRKLWRVINTGKADDCDFDNRYKNYSVMYTSDSEAKKFLLAEAAATAAVMAGRNKCR